MKDCMSSQDTSNPSRRISAWVPLAAFAGTSIALAIPLVVLARRRNSVLRKALSESNAAPPRRSANSGRVARPSTPSSQSSETKGSSVHFVTPGAGELLSAISKADSSTALWAGKAFAIATGIVTVGGIALVFAVQSSMGVKDTKEFADRMRTLVWRGLPGLTSQIHRPSDENDQGLPISESLEPDPTWKWEEAERRLQASYQQGGFSAWIETAMKELQDEVNIERARRHKEQESAETDRQLP